MKAVKRTQQVVELECDKGEVKAQWVIRPLTNGENSYIRDRVTTIKQDSPEDKPEVLFQTGESQLLTIAMGLIDVTGFYDDSGNELHPEFRKEGRFTLIVNRWLDLLPPDVYDELIDRISRITQLTNAQAQDLEFFREVDNGRDIQQL